MPLAMLALASMLLPRATFAAPPLGSTAQLARIAAERASVPSPEEAHVIDRPGDDGRALLVTFSMNPPASGKVLLQPQVQDGGIWLPTVDAEHQIELGPGLDTVGNHPEWFGYNPPNADQYLIVVDHYLAPAETAGAPGATIAESGGELTADAGNDMDETPLATGIEYPVRLTVTNAQATATFDLGKAAPKENPFAPAKTNVLLISIFFTAIILTAIYIARNHGSKLFIRRIAGLEAVEEAIGRATEMGKPVMQINGLDPLSTLSTVAAVNMLGQIAHKVAHYDSRLMVPAFDPIVMNVSREMVRQAYIEEGRPDAYREDDIFFVTDQQFSYVASVCGLIMRERPAAIFLLGYYYAESLMLAETGQSTGAIQIAGTDSQSQLPFFITACDYTLIGEELYAASAYLSREPMLLGSLKGQDLAKAIIMVVLLLGTILATIQVMAIQANPHAHFDFLTKMLTVLN